MYWTYLENDFIFDVWPEAEELDPSVLDRFMNTANALCVAYAPALPDGAIVSDSYKMAEVFQARHLWSQAGNGAKGTEFDDNGQIIPSYPLVFAARDLLRPKTSPLRRLGR